MSGPSPASAIAATPRSAAAACAPLIRSLEEVSELKRSLGLLQPSSTLRGVEDGAREIPETVRRTFGRGMELRDKRHGVFSQRWRRGRQQGSL